MFGSYQNQNITTSKKSNGIGCLNGRRLALITKAVDLNPRRRYKVDELLHPYETKHVITYPCLDLG